MRLHDGEEFGATSALTNHGEELIESIAQTANIRASVRLPLDQQALRPIQRLVDPRAIPVALHRRVCAGDRVCFEPLEGRVEQVARASREFNDVRARV